MPWLVVALSMFASLTSAISYMGVPGTVYHENTSLLFGFIISPIVAPVLVFLFYPFYRRLQVTTSYEYIGRRFGPAGRYAASVLFLLARIGWLGTVIFAPALALSAATGLHLTLSILLMGVLATTYTVLGGLTAVLWTDVAQFIILTGGAVWIAITLLLNVPDGFAGIMEIARQTDHLKLASWRPSLVEMTVPVVVISYFLSFMQDYGTDQVTVQRLLAVRTFRGMAKAAILNSFFDLFIMSLLLFLGLGMFAFYHTYPELLAEGLQKNEILPYYIMQALPVGVSGLVITGIFAAAMSSMDSGINSLATVVTNDLIRPLRRTAHSETEDVKLARILTLVLGIFATGVAFVVSQIEDILQASQTFLGLFTGPILALFLLGILTRRGHVRGWLVGTAISVVATFWLQRFTEAHWTLYFPFAFAVSFVIGYLGSLAIRRPLAPVELTLRGRRQLGELT